MCTVAAAVAAASGAASVRVWHITSRGWDPWTERPLPEVVRVAYPLDFSACRKNLIIQLAPSGGEGDRLGVLGVWPELDGPSRLQSTSSF